MNRTSKFRAAHVFGWFTPRPDDYRGPPHTDPFWWSKMTGSGVPSTKFADRVPFLGEYNVKDPVTMAAIAKEMVRGEIDCVSLCTFFRGQEKKIVDRAFLDGLKVCEVERKPKHYLALELTGSFRPDSPIQNMAHLMYLIEEIAREMEHPDYWHIDGMPVLSILNVEHFISNIVNQFLGGISLGEVFDLIRKNSDKTPYFVINCETIPHWVSTAEKAGAHCISAYNYVRPIQNRNTDNPTPGPTAPNTEAMLALYEDAWRWLLNRGKTDVILPLTLGFLSVNDFEAQIGLFTDEQRQRHFKLAAQLRDAYDKCRGTIVNSLDEHWEGPSMLPDVLHGRRVMADHREILA